MAITSTEELAIAEMTQKESAETDYLLRNPANAEHLHRSIKASRRGSTKRRNMDKFEVLCDAQSSADD